MKKIAEKISGFADKLELKLALFLPSLSLLCAIILYALPGPSIAAMEYLTHGTFQYAIVPFDLARIALGLILWAVIGFVAGWLYLKISALVNHR